jgi:hypothetical protein
MTGKRVNRKTDMPNLYVALAHYPVVNKNDTVIASAITNLDLHDIARAAKTYGVKSYYVVTPLEDQQVLAKKIISHWVAGAGADYNPSRGSALELIIIKSSLAETAEHIKRVENEYPKIVATCARRHPSNISFEEFRGLLDKDRPHLLVFGTAWGLAETFISEADYVLEPISGITEYNHLSVRAAAAIILDRLIAEKN